MKTDLHHLKACLGIVIILLTGCSMNKSEIAQASPTQELVGFNAAISACGGFEKGTTSRATAQTSEQCRDEQLVWQYHPQIGTLSLQNQNVWLNCCGKRAISVSLNQDTRQYEMYETDTPQPPEDRCYCMCFVDFAIDVPNIAEQSFPLNLFRHITDEGPEQNVWVGTIELQEGSGTIVLQQAVGYCD